MDNMDTHKQANRSIPVNRDIIPQRAPVPRRVWDYNHIDPAHVRIAQRLSSPLLLGPPLCDQLVALVQHLFTREEALLVQHMRIPFGNTARTIAKRAGLAVNRAAAVLDYLADEKCVIMAYTIGRRRRYGFLPIVPGIFEYALMQAREEQLTDWHKQFARLFEQLFDTGYFKTYARSGKPLIRYLPAQRLVEQPQALPSDRLADVLTAYDAFAVGLCQCRLAERMAGRGCDAPIDNCVAFGDSARLMVHAGKMRSATLEEVLAIKADAEAHGLATFVVEYTMGKNRGGGSCSCCGCCCHGLKMITQFDTPGLVAPSRFAPHWQSEKCVFCSACVTACPVGAIRLDKGANRLSFKEDYCIGCGLCAVACKPQAIAMQPRQGYHRPPRHLAGILLQLLPHLWRMVLMARRRKRVST